MNIRPNRIKEQLAAGRVATILSGCNDPDLIDQLGTLDVDGIWLEASTAAWTMPTSATHAPGSLGQDLGRPRDGQRLRHDLSHARPRSAGDLCAPRQAPRPRRWWRRPVRAARQARHVHEPSGLRVDGYLKTANDPSLLLILIEDINRRAQSRRDPQGEPHRRLRGAQRPGHLDGPHRQHGPSRRPAGRSTARSRRSSSPSAPAR